jgi:hypothetical protein
MPGGKTKCASCKTKRNTRLCLDKESGALEIRDTIGMDRAAKMAGCSSSKREGGAAMRHLFSDAYEETYAI